jgi:hypothetical protein
MNAVTVDFPEGLAQQIEEQGISQTQLRTAILRFVELYVSNKQAGKTEGQLWTSGAEFASRLLTNNRQLFEELAKH